MRDRREVEWRGRRGEAGRGQVEVRQELDRL